MYSNDDLGRIISLVSIAGKIEGRTKFQKMIYILQCKGAGFGERFKYHHYGPYSSDLQFEIEELVDNNKISEIISNNFDTTTYSYSIYSITSNPEDKKPEVLEKFGKLISLLNGASSRILELVGTIFFLREEEGITNNSIIKAKLKFLKPHLESSIEEALGFETQVNSAL